MDLWVDDQWLHRALETGRHPDRVRRTSVLLHPHAFRHLVATRLDAAGLSAREIADYLGHERVR